MKKLILMLFSISVLGQKMKTDLEQAFNENQLMGLSVIVKNNKSTDEYYLGNRNIESALPVNKDTKYRVASISKILTGLGIMKLEGLKKIDLNEDISKYLGYSVRNPNFPEDKITVKMLLTHTTSLNDGTGYDNFLAATYDDNDIPNINSSFLKGGTFYSDDMWLNKKPGTFFTYCNLNYGVIGTIIEKISGKRFDVYMRDEILKPLGIKSSFSIQDFESVENIATLYRFKDNNWYATKDDFKGKKPNPSDMSTYVIGTNGSYFGPQGGLRLSAKDLIIVLDFLKSNGKTKPKIITQSSLKKMKEIQWKFDGTNGDSYNNFFNAWGIGLHYVNQNDADKIHDKNKYGSFVGHAGDAYGLISDAYYSEKNNLSVVIIMNGTKDLKKGSGSFYKFEEDIYKLIQKNY